MVLDPIRQIWRAFAGFLLLFALLVLAEVAPAASPRLNLKPSHGLAGESIAANGRNFLPGSTGKVIWQPDGSLLGEFISNANGDFSVEFVVPQVAPGDYSVVAVTLEEQAIETFEVDAGDWTDEPVADEGAARQVDPMPNWMREIALPQMPDLCPVDPRRLIEVHDAADLTLALADAEPGDAIRMADGLYSGAFVINRSGTADSPIWLCGSRAAAIDSGDFGNGYGLHITGDYAGIQGIVISNALKGVILDDADFVTLNGIEVHTTGHEAVHFRRHSADNLIQFSDIHNTGLKRDKFGEGIYLGSAVSNWSNHSDGEPDRSDRIRVLYNRVWDVTSEAIDIKEGTTDGLIEGNLMDGSSLAGADSWIDVKGSNYLIRSNHGQNATGDGYQTHVINNLEWGTENTFDANIALVNSGDFGFYIHDPQTSDNHVMCSNEVSEAGSGFANVTCQEQN